MYLNSRYETNVGKINTTYAIKKTRYIVNHYCRRLIDTGAASFLTSSRCLMSSPLSPHHRSYHVSCRYRPYPHRIPTPVFMEGSFANTHDCTNIQMCHCMFSVGVMYRMEVLAPFSQHSHLVGCCMPTWWGTRKER